MRKWNGGERKSGVVLEKEWAIKQSKHLLCDQKGGTCWAEGERAVPSEMDDELEVAREVGVLEPSGVMEGLMLFFESRASPRTRER